MNQKLEDFFLTKSEPSKSCFLALREILLQHQLEETIKYGMPCYTYRSKALCYLWADKKSKDPYILFVDGLQLDHPKLEQGDRSKMKVLLIDPKADLDLDILDELLLSAIQLKD